MAENRDKLEWWGKSESDPKAQPKPKVQPKLQTATKPKSEAAVKPKGEAAVKPKGEAAVKPKAEQKPKGERSEPKQRKPKQPKAPLSKMALFLRTIKHSIYMALIVVGGAVGAHYLLTGVTRHGAGCTVPQLESLTIAEAERVVAANELQLIINDSLYAPAYRGGAILDQLPKAGVVVKPGRAIYLTVNATQRRIVDVPYVAERSLRQAKNMLRMSGLTVGELKYVDDLAKNYVLAQSVGEVQIKADNKERAPMGSEVTLTIGRGSDDRTLVPMVLGLSLRDAKDRLFDAGLNVGELHFDSDVDPVMNLQAMVYTQSDMPESTTRFGERISLELSGLQTKVDSMILVHYREVKEMEVMIELEMMFDEAAYREVDGVWVWEYQEADDLSEDWDLNEPTGEIEESLKDEL
ncbi:MAG: PASTA domain-containing protein [Rikenellaceae bacterium]